MARHTTSAGSGRKMALMGALPVAATLASLGAGSALAHEAPRPDHTSSTTTQDAQGGDAYSPQVNRPANISSIGLGRGSDDAASSKRDSSSKDDSSSKKESSSKDDCAAKGRGGGRDDDGRRHHHGHGHRHGGQSIRQSDANSTSTGAGNTARTVVEGHGHRHGHGHGSSASTAQEARGGTAVSPQVNAPTNLSVVSFGGGGQEIDQENVNETRTGAGNTASTAVGGEHGHGRSATLQKATGGTAISPQTNTPTNLSVVSLGGGAQKIHQANSNRTDTGAGNQSTMLSF